MSPSRGAPETSTTTTTSSSSTTTISSSAAAPSPTDLKADLRSTSALTLFRQNLSYLLHPSSPASPAPAKLRTRALLRTLHYLSVFLFWRLVRYARYALVGTLVAAAGSTAVGSGVAFVVAPPTLLATVGVGLAWAVGKWGFRRLGGPERVVEGVGRGRREVVVDGSWGGEQGPGVVPW